MPTAQEAAHGNNQPRVDGSRKSDKDLLVRKDIDSEVARGDVSRAGRAGRTSEPIDRRKSRHTVLIAPGSIERSAGRDQVGYATKRERRRRPIR